MFQDPAFQEFAHFENHARTADAEIAHLFGQAGVHIIDVRIAEKFSQQRADNHGFFVRVNAIVVARQRHAKRLHEQGDVQQNFCPRRPDFHLLDKGQLQRTINPDVGNVDIFADRIGDQINRMP